MSEPVPALVTAGVTHAFGDRPALQDCSFTVPAGSVTALVGRNGAGKTTLLRAAAGLLRPQRGHLAVFGDRVGDASLPCIGYAGQQAPLYRTLTVAQTLRLGARLNPRWDAPYARRLADAAQLPPAAKVGTLAPGHRARLALIMALGKRPGLLLLDEPLAHLDPVARTEAVGMLMADVAEHGTTVVLSSHVVADIEGVCDHVVVLADGRVRLAADVEQALGAHHVAVGGAGDLGALDGAEIVESQPDGPGFTALVRIAEPVLAGRLSWHRPTLEELLLGYLRAPGIPSLQEVPVR
ncbi:ABC transporter ATP-binding protein [Actinoplanes sp. NPDC049681]|uniref:ABC transporter ATP-binding protein n=1 Tax=Actinoplanes sp. NPDC049681 TaxID=3363905 RepID=UPI00378D13B9